jgi:hypothetical protein
MTLARVISPAAALLMLLAVGVTPSTATAQESTQDTSACPPTQIDGTVKVCVDRGPDSIYYEGDSITICVVANVPQILIFPPPPPPTVRVIAQTAEDTPQTIIEDDFASGSRCVNGVITAPFGVETISAEVIGTNGQVIATDSLTFLSQPFISTAPAAGVE